MRHHVSTFTLLDPGALQTFERMHFRLRAIMMPPPSLSQILLALFAPQVSQGTLAARQVTAPKQIVAATVKVLH
jgi:hypothetical protein